MPVLKNKTCYGPKDNMIPIIGKYDSNSKYNTKNVSRLIKEKQEVLSVPYYTLLFEACEEGKIADFILKLKTLSSNSTAAFVLSEIDRASTTILDKLQQLKSQI